MVKQLMAIVAVLLTVQLVSHGNPTTAAENEINEKLLAAVLSNNIGAVRQVIGQGADPFTANKNGLAAVDVAVDHGFYDIAHYLLAVQNQRVTSGRADNRESTTSTPPSLKTVNISLQSADTSSTEMSSKQSDPNLEEIKQENTVPVSQTVELAKIIAPQTIELLETQSTGQSVRREESAALSENGNHTSGALEREGNPVVEKELASANKEKVNAKKDDPSLIDRLYNLFDAEEEEMVAETVPVKQPTQLSIQTEISPEITIKPEPVVAPTFNQQRSVETLPAPHSGSPPQTIISHYSGEPVTDNQISQPVRSDTTQLTPERFANKKPASLETNLNPKVEGPALPSGGNAIEPISATVTTPESQETSLFDQISAFLHSGTTPKKPEPALTIKDGNQGDPQSSRNVKTQTVSSIELANINAEPEDARPPLFPVGAPSVNPEIPKKPLRRLSLGRTGRLGKAREVSEDDNVNCIRKSRLKSVFCIENLGWPNDIASALVRNGRAIVHYDEGGSSQYHVSFPAHLYQKLTHYLTMKFGTPTETPDIWTVMLGEPKRYNKTLRWRRTAEKGDFEMIEVREIDDLRWSSPPDIKNGVVRLYREGADPVFKSLTTSDLLLLQVGVHVRNNN